MKNYPENGLALSVSLLGLNGCRRRVVGTAILISLAVLSLSSRLALALTVTSAKVAKGAVEVRGRDAAPKASITWEGQVVGQANKSGGFHFETPLLPSDCVGELSDGVETIPVVVQSCGPVGATGPQGPAGPPGPAATNLVVFDAAGQEVGPVIETSGSDQARVALKVNGYTFLVHMKKNEFVRNNGLPYFEATDCSGTPLTNWPNSLLVPIAEIGNPGRTAYLPDPNATPRTVTVRSRLFSFPDGCVTLESTMENMVPGIPLINLDTTFTPPFHIELER